MRVPGRWKALLSPWRRGGFSVQEPHCAHRQRHGLRRPAQNRSEPTRRYLGPHIFDRVCNEHGIEHRLTEPYHPWTNGQAERMNRTVKEATTKIYHYEDLESMKAHILVFVTAYNVAKHLKSLRWRTPFETVCEAWTNDPGRFKIKPHHLIPGPYIGHNTVFQ